MKEFALKYGCNPHQKPARIYVEEGEAISSGDLLLEVKEK